MTESEKFVFELSKEACLSLWTYANPLLEHNGNELCDVLVACKPDVLVFSVKAITLRQDGERDVQIARWKRRAIEDSITQLFGAQRRLSEIDKIFTSERQAGVTLGERSERRVHLIAIAIGAGQNVALESKFFEKGFVHVFDDETLLLLLQELDTIVDFTQYLSDREALLSRDLSVPMIATEADLLATYILSNRSFKQLLETDAQLIVLDGSWDDFRNGSAYAAKKKADEGSYFWDRLISQVHNDYINDFMEFGGDLNSVDETTRVMARESRLSRRHLAAAFVEFMNQTHRARQTAAISGTQYVFLKTPHSESRDDRVKELQLRCVVARTDLDKKATYSVVFGLATEINEPGSGFSLDCCLFDFPEWTDELREGAERIRNDLGYFKNPVFSTRRIEEFPGE